MAVKERCLLYRDKEPEDAPENVHISHVPVSVYTQVQIDENEDVRANGQRVRGQAVPEPSAAQGTFTLSFIILWSLAFFPNGNLPKRINSHQKIGIPMLNTDKQNYSDCLKCTLGTAELEASHHFLDVFICNEA